jgi:hypothetical protein
VPPQKTLTRVGVWTAAFREVRSGRDFHLGDPDNADAPGKRFRVREVVEHSHALNAVRIELPGLNNERRHFVASACG